MFNKPSFGSPAKATGFGAPSTALTSFGGTANAFGAATNAFGAATNAFGAPSATGFGAPAPASGSSGFGAPAATGFGAMTAAGFGAQLSTGFGAPATGFGATAGFGIGPVLTAFGQPGQTGMGFGGSSNTQLTLQAAPQLNEIGQMFMDIKSKYAPCVDVSGQPCSTVNQVTASSATALTTAPATSSGLTFSGLGSAFGQSMMTTPAAAPPVATTRPNTRGCSFSAVAYKKNSRQYQSVIGDAPGGDQQLEQAERNNPDPEHLHPEIQLGIAALMTRFEAQNSDMTQSKQQVKDLTELLNAVERAHAQTITRCDRLRAQQTQLTARMMASIKKVEILRGHGTPLQPSEIRFRERLMTLFSSLEDPTTKLQQLMVTQGQQERRQERFVDHVSESDMDAIYQALEQQREGIQHLTDVLEKDARDICIMKNELARRSGHHLSLM